MISCMQLTYIFYCKTYCFAAFDDFFFHLLIDAYREFQMCALRKNCSFALQVCKVLFWLVQIENQTSS